MAGKIQPKPNDPALSAEQTPQSTGCGVALQEVEALAGWEITTTDIARARAKWRRRVPDFEERIKVAAQAQPEKEAD